MTAKLAQSLGFMDTIGNPVRPGVKKTAAAVPNARAAERQARHVDKACAELESLFIHQLLKQMRATVPKSDLTGGGQAEALYTSMLDGETAKELAARGGIGLAVLLKDQLLDRMGPFPTTDASSNSGQDAKKLKRMRPLTDNNDRFRRS
jgi:peptidoglycan hydrolase FlgJ